MKRAMKEEWKESRWSRLWGQGDQEAQVQAPMELYVDLPVQIAVMAQRVAVWPVLCTGPVPLHPAWA